MASETATESERRHFLPLERRVTRGAWRHSRATNRAHPVWQVTDPMRDVLAVVYTHESDAELMAAAPRMFSALKALVHAAPHSAAYVAALNVAQALLNELK